MSRRAFHGRALAVAGLVALGCLAVARWLSGLELSGPGFRQTTGEIWLLSVFTAGVLALLLGLSSVVGGRWGGALGDRLRADRGAPETDPDASAEAGAGTTGDDGVRAGSWTMAVGAWLLGLYLLGWLLGAGAG